MGELIRELATSGRIITTSALRALQTGSARDPGLWLNAVGDGLDYLIRGGPGAPPESAPPASPVWTIADDGHFVTAESDLIKAVFSYNPAGTGWFTGGGGKDGSLWQLYHKPTSESRNLVFNNHTYGGNYTALDRWESDWTAVDQRTFNSPDGNTGDKATGFRWTDRSESAGRAMLEHTFVYAPAPGVAGWEITRRYCLWPHGLITIGATLRVSQEGPASYLGRRFNLAGKLVTFQKDGIVYNWGGQYVGEHCDGVSDGYHYQSGEPLSLRAIQDHILLGTENLNRTCHISNPAAPGAWSGFVVADGDGNDPSIVVMNAEGPNQAKGTYGRIARAVGNDTRSPKDAQGQNLYGLYSELAFYNFAWNPPPGMQVGNTWFYMTRPATATDGNPWNKRGYWTPGLGTFDELHHVFLGRYRDADDYLALWQAYVADRAAAAPTGVTGATPYLDSTLGVWQLDATAGVQAVRFDWRRASAHPAGRPLNYGTPFVIADLARPRTVTILGPGGPMPCRWWHDAKWDETVVVLDFEQPGTPETYTITVAQ